MDVKIVVAGGWNEEQRGSNDWHEGGFIEFALLWVKLEPR